MIHNTFILSSSVLHYFQNNILPITRMYKHEIDSRRTRRQIALRLIVLRNLISLKIKNIHTMKTKRKTLQNDLSICGVRADNDFRTITLRNG